MILFIRIISLLMLGIITSGCIEVNTTIKLNKDGSGTVEETVFMNSAIVDMIKEFTASFSDDTINAEEFSLFDEEELKIRAGELGEGVSYLSGIRLSEDGKEGYKAVFGFSDVNKLKVDQNPNSRIPDSPESEPVPEEKEYLTFEFSKGDSPEIIIHMPDLKDKKDESYVEDDEMVDEEFHQDSLNADTSGISQFKNFLKDFRISLDIQVDGEIESTNATYVEGRNISLFKIDFEKLIENTEKLEQLRQANPDNFQEVKNMLRDIPGIQIEVTDPVRIKFR
jgi:hypothetical protein